MSRDATRRFCWRSVPVLLAQCIGSAGATKRGKVPYRASDVDLWYGSVFFDLARAQCAGDAWGRVSDILTCPIAWVICLLFEWQFLKV